jgi:ABC-type uncharacterized transport system substrate-binding protein
MRVQAAELVSLKPDVIVGASTPVVVALRAETRTIPILFVQVIDPVVAGFVTSLARPEGNITGITNFEFTIGGKWLEILKEMSPQLTRVAVLYFPKTPRRRGDRMTRRAFVNNRMRFIHNFPATTLSRMTIGSKSVASPCPDSFAAVF